MQHAIKVLDNLSHRGATGCDPRTGDGAGLLLQLPHKFLSRCAKDEGFVDAKKLGPVFASVQGADSIPKRR